MTDPTANTLVGRTLGGKFLVRREIGRGGMGAVYEAEHIITKRVGALKLLHARLAAVKVVVARFVREASAAGHIENPHIVMAYDAGELASGEPYLFMELLKGRPVSSLLEARGRLPFGEAREIVVQAAEALAAAHATGIVHRDVKPENLFLCEGPLPFVKVLDFGISKFSPQLVSFQPLTQDAAPMGSPYYMSPEQVVGKRDIDFRTDVYSLAVVLYECLTGARPFTADTLTELGVKIFEGRYIRASELVPALPAGVDELLATAMQVEASRRHASMKEFRAALLGLGEPSALATSPGFVISRPPTKPFAAPRRRRLGFVLLAGVVSALLALALAVSEPRPPTEPRRITPSAPPVDGAATAHSAATSREPQAHVDRAQGEPARAAPPPAPRDSASSAPRPPKAASGMRPTAASSSRARQDGLIEANPF